MNNITILAMVGLLLCLFAGCSAPKQVAASEPVCLPQISEQQAMELARTVLGQMHFSMEKYDPQARYMRTRPLSGAQFFQVGRQDNASGYAAAEANLQSIRRIVEIEMTPYANRVCLECRVFVQQLSLPEEPIKGVISMAGNYTDSTASKQTLRLENEQLEKMEWLDNGLDWALEQKILKRIKKEAVK